MTDRAPARQRRRATRSWRRVDSSPSTGAHTSAPAPATRPTGGRADGAPRVAAIRPPSRGGSRAVPAASSATRHARAVLRARSRNARAAARASARAPRPRRHDAQPVSPPARPGRPRAGRAGPTSQVRAADVAAAVVEREQEPARQRGQRRVGAQRPVEGVDQRVADVRRARRARSAGRRRRCAPARASRRQQPGGGQPARPAGAASSRRRPRSWTLPARGEVARAPSPRSSAQPASACSAAASTAPPGSRTRASAPSAASCRAARPGQASGRVDTATLQAPGRRAARATRRSEPSQGLTGRRGGPESGRDRQPIRRAAEEAGANPARSRHCHRGADPADGHGAHGPEGRGARRSGSQETPAAAHRQPGARTREEGTPWRQHPAAVDVRHRPALGARVGRGLPARQPGPHRPPRTCRPCWTAPTWSSCGCSAAPAPGTRAWTRVRATGAAGGGARRRAGPRRRADGAVHGARGRRRGGARLPGARRPGQPRPAARLPVRHGPAHRARLRRRPRAADVGVLERAATRRRRRPDRRRPLLPGPPPGRQHRLRRGALRGDRGRRGAARCRSSAPRCARPSPSCCDTLRRRRRPGRHRARRGRHQARRGLGRRRRRGLGRRPRSPRSTCRSCRGSA